MTIKTAPRARLVPMSVRPAVGGIAMGMRADLRYLDPDITITGDIGTVAELRRSAHASLTRAVDFLEQISNEG